MDNSRWILLDDGDKKFETMKTWPNNAAQVVAEYNGVDDGGGQSVGRKNLWKICKGRRFGGTFTKAPILRQFRHIKGLRFDSFLSSFCTKFLFAKRTSSRCSLSSGNILRKKMSKPRMRAEILGRIAGRMSKEFCHYQELVARKYYLQSLPKDLLMDFATIAISTNWKGTSYNPIRSSLQSTGCRRGSYAFWACLRLSPTRLLQRYKSPFQITGLKLEIPFC